MDAQAHLMALGWAGPGHPLHPSAYKQKGHRGLAYDPNASCRSSGLIKPLLVSKKDNNLGLGRRAHEPQQGNEWWLKGFEKALGDIGKSESERSSGISTPVNDYMGKHGGLTNGNQPSEKKAASGFEAVASYFDVRETEEKERRKRGTAAQRQDKTTLQKEYSQAAEYFESDGGENEQVKPSNKQKKQKKQESEALSEVPGADAGETKEERRERRRRRKEEKATRRALAVSRDDDNISKQAVDMSTIIRSLDDRRKAFLTRVRTSRQWKRFPEQEKVAPPEGKEPTPENFTMLQAFEWYVPDDNKHWQRLTKALPGLRATGIDNLWIPPACKASSPSGNGYDIYDLYDLGEFDAKGSKGTKWGTKAELLELAHKAKELGIGIYFDAVLNHKAAADHTEKCRVVKVNPDNRSETISDVFEIEGWLGFDFAARGDKYSSQKYHWYHFSATDYDAASGQTAIYKILGDNKNFATDVDSEKGNFDYLMFADLDYAHPEVQDDVKNWGLWVAKELNLRGFRFDAIKHYSESFLRDFVHNLDQDAAEGWFLVGEFWKTSLPGLTEYLSKMDHQFSLFDAPLVENFHRISTGDGADLRQVFDNTLTQAEPYNSVSLVMNHDTQPGQALQLDVAEWFVPLAYAFILLRQSGYPCLFYGDLYGLKGGVQDNWRPPAAQGKIPDMALARKLYSYGEQNDYFDNPNCIGWVRRGTWDHPDGLAVIMSNTGESEKRMFVGEVHKGEKWTDILGWEQKEIEIGDDGFGLFPVGNVTLRIYVNKDAKGRDLFGKFNEKIYE
ncbi:hypothetical protein DV737_g2107, partial [Chaetothyriales sp. CBS 132003]